jgi:prepilin-type N-terminal cleavage/methylation domain-containing protein
MTRPFFTRFRGVGQGGFSATELVVVVAVIGILMAVAMPFFISFLRTSRLRAGAEEMVTVLGQARQLAIRNNRRVCVTIVNVDATRTAIQYLVGTAADCSGGTIWTGPSTDGAGFIQLGNGITVTSAQNAVFTYIGTAELAGGTYTVTNPQNASTLSVSVAPSGRISTAP